MWTPDALSSEAQSYRGDVWRVVEAQSRASTMRLTTPPLDRDEATWTDLRDYTACQDLADSARAAGIQAIRYHSVRDPDRGCNVAILAPEALAAAEPQQLQTWLIFIRPTGVQAARQFPKAEREFTRTDFGADSRLDGFWER